MGNAAHVMVVDDCEIVRDAVSAQLAAAGHSVASAADGRSMRLRFEEQSPDLVVLDLQLPDEDGFALLKLIRLQSDCGIIMLSSRGDARRRSIALDLGADDFVVKPHDARELLARIKAVLRRRMLSSRPEKPSQSVRGFGSWAFDPTARLVRAGGRVAHLTGAEFALMNALTQEPGQTVTREHLLEVVFQRSWTYEDRGIDVLVTRTRRKLESLIPGERPIGSVRGVGYFLRQGGQAHP